MSLIVGDVAPCDPPSGNSTGAALGVSAPLVPQRQSRKPRVIEAKHLTFSSSKPNTGSSSRVGDGSIEIRADGKILIKGTDLVSHAKRMNRIKGGAVSIN